MKLQTAYLCYLCEKIEDGAPQGGGAVPGLRRPKGHG